MSGLLAVCARGARRCTLPTVLGTALPRYTAASTVPLGLPQARLASGSASTAASSPHSLAGKHKPIVSQGSVVGTHPTHMLDMSQTAVGQVIDVPYESTVGASEQALWQSAFQVFDRIYSSTPFAQVLHLPQHIMPFYMMLFKAISMGHVDETRDVLDIGFERATYIRPAYSGDTLRQQFTIQHIKNTSNGENCLLTVGCELFNQRDQLIFSADKTMLYPGVKAPSFRMSPAPATPPAKPRSHLLSHILYNSDSLATTNNLALLQPGQLVLHSVSRPIGSSTNMALSTLFRWTHPSIYNLKRYKDEELLVPGGLVLAAAVSASSRGLFETLNESLDSCSFLNKVSPVDLIGAMTYVHKINQIKEGIEEVVVTTLGLKNVDVTRELQDVAIPVELFTQSLHRKQVEALVAEKCPILTGKIVVKATRTIVRQSPFAQQRSIPLL